jgi:hypothetical protein
MLQKRFRNNLCGHWMSCPRCDATTQIVSEYYNFNEKSFVRDTICVNCNSATVEKFYEDSTYRSEWIDLNV